jgi:pyruvate,orthophosphate dikinase
LGLNDESVNTIAAQADPRFAWDSYRRLVQMFSKVVLDVEGHLFEEIIQEIKAEEGVTADPQVSPKGWQKAVEKFKALVKRESGVEFFGNIGKDSGSGVALTRNPSTGENDFFGEYLFNAQGEDVVSGARTPTEVHKLQVEAPQAWEALMKVSKTLETHYKEMQDMEFTIQNGKLYMLQTRNGKRTAAAAVKIAVDMVEEGLITKEDAVMRIEHFQVDQLLHPRFDDASRKAAVKLTKGLNASPGAAVGEVYFDADTAEKKAKEEGKAVILVRPETNPDDVHGMLAAKGVLTQHGGATSHAAVVARQLGKPCGAGAEEIKIDLRARTMTVKGITIKEGDVISLDGAAGEVYQGALKPVAPDFDEQKELLMILGWADEIRKLMVWANADDPKQAKRARNFGAQGIGLCRTEHMFLGEPHRDVPGSHPGRTDESSNRVWTSPAAPPARRRYTAPKGNGRPACLHPLLDRR